jgi:catechol 2,3-dioxygenase-like lactoylglutathione lyase family enzyme
MIDVNGVVQSAFIVKDIGEAIRFYQDLFGFTLARSPEPDWPCAWLQIAANQQLHLIEREEPEQFLSPESVRHLGLGVPNLGTAVAELAKADVTAFCYDPQGNRKDVTSENVQLMGTQAVFFRDPSGNLIKLVQSRNGA